MKRFFWKTTLLAAVSLVSVTGNAREWMSGTGKTNAPKSSYKTEAGDCVSPSAQFDMDINNVRARLLTGGDAWWNLSEARYQVPKGDGTGASLNALFAGAIWISGYDAGNNLKVAAQRYRQGGDDYWPGPVNTSSTVDKATCSKYDRFFSVLGADIEKAQTAFLQKGSQTTIADIPKSVLAWPAKGNQYLQTDPTLIGETFLITDNLAPFKDVDNNGEYDPVKGDYPIIPCRNGEAEAYGDQMVFWVFNDVGNQHTESNGQSIGVQVNALAFAFQTTDDVNNMTFYKYEIINKSPNPLLKTYVSQWSDPDLGCFSNDAVGCDVNRSLGIVYNRSAIDNDCNGVSGYGSDLPLIGIDFFEGPISDSGQQLGLSSFVYFTNGATTSQSDPASAAQYRNYMTGLWADGTPFTYGGTGYNSGGPVTKFIFPGNPAISTEWSEVNPQGTAIAPGDRRMVQTSGPFTLVPGQSQYITVGVVFVRPAGGVGNPPNFATSIGPADDKAQALFNTCFKLVDGPDAPTLQIRELANQIIINLLNLPGSNNEGEGYDQVDGQVAQIIYSDLAGKGDSTYTFEGYKLYQVADPKVAATDLDNPAKALLIAQVDIKNGVSKIINFVKDATLNLSVPVLMVDGADKGITNSFNITTDYFATGNNAALVNHKTYYYTAVAYSYNNYKQFDQGNPSAGGQQLPYLQGRGNFKVYSAIPHMPDPRNNGTTLTSAWGDGVEVKRIEGRGNGGNNLFLTAETIAQILGSGSSLSDTLTYQKGFDPIGFRITDPVALKESNFELQVVEQLDTPIGVKTTWYLRDLISGDTIFGDRALDRPYPQQIVATKNGSVTDYGFSITLGTPAPVHTIPGQYLNHPVNSPARYVYDVQESSIEFQNPVDRWLSFVKDEGTSQPSNWIRSGVNMNDPASDAKNTKASAESFDDNWYYTTPTPPSPVFQNTDTRMTDSTEVFENILDGTWAPYCLTSNYSKRNLTATELDAGKPPYVYGPGFKWRNYSSHVPPENNLDSIFSVDIVITPDRSKWSRCVVFETGEDESINLGADIAPNGKSARKGQIRMAISKVMDNNGNLVTDPTQIDTGRSYFPGYAINVETGERLNIAFGESSDQGDQNGRDMLWDPTHDVYSAISFPGNLIDRIPYFGGKHFIYVMKSRYDGGAGAQRLLLDNYTGVGTSNPFSIPAPLRLLYRSLTWTSIPYITNGYELQPDGNGVKYIPPSEVKIHLRVERPYDRFLTNASNGIDSLPRYQFSTIGLGTKEEQKDIAKSALDNIRAVPNPYLAYSIYETDQNSSKIKITNLPNTCTVTIFSMDGTIIRKLERSIGVDPATNKKIDISEGNSVDEINLDNSIEWDLKNQKGITVSSGMYLIHVEAPGIGERTIKWFGAIRPADTSNF